MKDPTPVIGRCLQQQLLIPGMNGSLSVSGTLRSVCVIQAIAMTVTFGAVRISMLMAIGPTSGTTAGSGDPMSLSSTTIPTGRRIAMAPGLGFGPTAGLGSDMSHGVGLPITTDAGFTTTTIGRGVLAVITTVTGVGGDQRS